MLFVFIQRALRKTFLLFVSPARTAEIVQDESLTESILYWLIVGFSAFGIFISAVCWILYEGANAHQIGFVFRMFVSSHLGFLVGSAVLPAILYGLSQASGTSLGWEESVKISCTAYPALIIPLYVGATTTSLITYAEGWLSLEAIGFTLLCLLYGVIWSGFVASYLVQRYSNRSMLFSIGLVVLSALILYALNIVVALSGYFT
ncbi:hypothetical protein [Methanoculleus bourgensis]|uniref:hypothetical protein n=1 Tax=Methanoculleus bourgensis TaxID=83986 RepID=UPI0022EF53E9|nr:hypothetical protein [Methanoculleus bourgensis]GLI47475.1 hypothetical protein MBOURGENBZM_22670 [Methanoculleus bourgensis]